MGVQGIITFHYHSLSGIYLIQEILKVPLYIVLPDEVESTLDRELALLRKFATGHIRKEYLSAIMHKIIAGDKELAEYLHIAFSLYEIDIKAAGYTPDQIGKFTGYSKEQIRKLLNLEFLFLNKPPSKIWLFRVLCG